jgi:hypothetical protein
MATKPLDGWADEKKDGKPTQFVGCGNHHFHCGKQCRIVGFDPAAESIIAEGWNPKVRLCIGCCNSIAYRWGVAFEDLDFLMSAIQAAKAGKCGVKPTRDEIWAILAKVGVKPVRKPAQVEWSATKPAGLPVGDLT